MSASVLTTALSSVRARINAPAVGPAVFFGMLALVYTAYARAHCSHRLYGDEWRYLWYAENLLRGYFSPPDYVFLWNGPGYPLFLSPFVALQLSPDVMRTVNGVLLAGAQALFFVFVHQFASVRTALFFTLFLVLYIPALQFLHLVYTESIALLLVSALLVTTAGYVRRGGTARLWFCGGAFAALIMVKIGFWPMLFGGVTVFGGLFALTRQPAFKRLTAAMLVAVGLCVPYLAYTYQVTGRVFYWGSAGGSMMYWITNPSDEGHYGEWFHQGHVQSIPAVRRDHWSFIKKLSKFDGQQGRGYTGLERIARELAPISSPEADDLFKQKAKEQLRSHPEKYLRNVGYNVGRLIWDFPTVRYGFGSKSLQLAICNSLVMLGALAALVRLIRRRAREPLVMSFVVWLFVSYLGLSCLITAIGRYFVTAAPLGLALVALAFAGPVDRWMEQLGAKKAAGEGG